MESKEHKSGFSEIDYKWDSRIRRSVVPSFIIYFVTIFMTDKSLMYGIEYIPLISVHVYYVYLFLYISYIYLQRKKYNQQLINQIKIPNLLKIIPIVLICIVTITFILWSFL
jgi:hypothetical protein